MSSSSASPSASSQATLAPAQLLFSDVAHELATTRRLLERVPDGQNDWRPHDKSMLLGRLATHVAELPRFTTTILTTDGLDWSPGSYKPTVAETTAERVALFDTLAAEMQNAIAAADWDALAKTWTMRAGDQVIINGTKGVLVRTAGIHHLIHHRAQLGVYLRLLNVPLPSSYGPSADES